MKCIYIVDGDRSFVQYFEDMIFNKAKEYKVVGHSFKANDFLQKLNDRPELLNRIDLLLINPKLNDLDGLELVKKIKTRKSDLNVAILLNENIKTFYINDIAEMGLENIILYPNSDDFYLEGLRKAFLTPETYSASSTSTSQGVKVTAKQTFENLKSSSFLDNFDFDDLSDDILGISSTMSDNNVSMDIEEKVDSNISLEGGSDIKSFDEYSNVDDNYNSLDFNQFENNVSSSESMFKDEFEDNSFNTSSNDWSSFGDENINHNYDVNKGGLNDFLNGFEEDNMGTSTDTFNLNSNKEGYEDALDLSNFGVSNNTDSFNMQNEFSDFGGVNENFYATESSMQDVSNNNFGNVEPKIDREFVNPTEGLSDDFSNFISQFEEPKKPEMPTNEQKSSYNPNMDNNSLKHKGFMNNNRNNSESNQNMASVPEQPYNSPSFGFDTNQNNNGFNMNNPDSSTGFNFDNTNKNDFGFNQNINPINDDFGFNQNNGQPNNGMFNGNDKRGSSYEAYPPNTFNQNVQTNRNAIDNIYGNSQVNELDFTPTQTGSNKEDIESIVDSSGTNADFNSIPDFAKQIVAFYSTKGGIGKTTLAINSTIQLAKYSNKKICIIDFDLTNANVHTHLGIFDSKYDISVVSNFESEIDTFTMQRLVTPYRVTDRNGIDVSFDVIVGFKEMRMAQRFDEKEVDKILSILIEMYDIVIVDTHPVYTDLAVSTILKKATKIIFVAEQEMTSLNGANDFIRASKRYGIPAEKLYMVLNRYKSTTPTFTKSAIQKNLHKEIYAQIPSNIDSLREAINTSIPITLANPECELSRAYLNVAKIIDKNLQVPETKSSFFSSIFKK